MKIIVNHTIEAKTIIIFKRVNINNFIHPYRLIGKEFCSFVNLRHCSFSTVFQYISFCTAALFYHFPIYGINLSMKEMLEQVFSEEEEARIQVRKARETAAEKTREAESEAARILEEARQEGQRIIKDARQKVREEADRAFQSAVREAEAEAERLKIQKGPAIDDTIEEVLEFLTAPSFQREG